MDSTVVRVGWVAVLLAPLGLGCVVRGTDAGPQGSSSTTIVVVSGTTDGDPSSECGGILSHSHETGDGCACDAGYRFENPGDPNDFTCVPIDQPGSCMEPNNVLVDGVCECEEGYVWCEPDDLYDYTCCDGGGPGPSSADETADTGNTDTFDVGGGSTGTDTGGTLPDPAGCTVDTPEVIYCTNTADDGPEGSGFYVCTDGRWVEMPESGDESCQFDGYDFAYGCIDDGQMIAFICGNGSGAPCEDDADAMCLDADVIDTCIFGRATEDSCATLCNTIGDERGVTYDSGFCDADAEPDDCVCCDVGDPGCPG